MPTGGKRAVIIVTDAAPFGDDGMAIAMLAVAPSIDIKLIVATSGNVWADEAARNVRAVLTRLERNDVPVSFGFSASTLQARLRILSESMIADSATHYIGALGRSGPPPSDDSSAREDLRQAIMASDRPDLLVIGPASELAGLVRSFTNLADHIGRVYLMGGALAKPGNATAVAEFNFWFNPLAAEALLASDLPITLLPFDAIQGVSYSARLEASLDPADLLGAYVRDCLLHAGALPVCDQILAAALLDATVISRCRCLKLQVETTPGAGYGKLSVADDTARRPVRVVEEVDMIAFERVVRHSLAAGAH
jgi:purine nucleosidase